MVDAGAETREAPGDHVDLHLVERAGRRGRAEVDRLAAGVDLLLRQPRREEQELGEHADVHRPMPRPGRDAREGLERRQSRRRHLAREWDGRRVRVDLEREGLDLPVEEVPAVPDALRRVLGCVVVRAD